MRSETDLYRVAHGLPHSKDNLLVMDYRRRFHRIHHRNGSLRSSWRACTWAASASAAVYFPDGKITRQNLKQAELRRAHRIANHRRGLQGTVASRPSVRRERQGPSRHPELNGYSANGITREGLDMLRAHLLKVATRRNSICRDCVRIACDTGRRLRHHVCRIFERAGHLQHETCAGRRCARAYCTICGALSRQTTCAT